MNLHGTVRGAITSVNPDTMIAWIASTGNTVSSSGKQTPTYATLLNIPGQVQAASTDVLAKYDFLQAQGIHRVVYFYGQVQAINRVRQLGGDKLQFPEISNGTVRTWLVVGVPEQWPDWCCVLCTLQLDPNNP